MRWEKEADQIRMKIAIPSCTEAELFAPGSLLTADGAKAQGKRIALQAGVHEITCTDEEG